MSLLDSPEIQRLQGEIWAQDIAQRYHRSFALAEAQRQGMTREQYIRADMAIYGATPELIDAVLRYLPTMPETSRPS